MLFINQVIKSAIKNHVKLEEKLLELEKLTELSIDEIIQAAKRGSLYVKIGNNMCPIEWANNPIMQTYMEPNVSMLTLLRNKLKKLLSLRRR